ncbi:hypothetical protein A9Q78_10185 [Methylophaga sp. 41_12_T18]|nr:hypothetical protein A9Q78_10185 [Methylophaga sp. 41_12_T18]
MEQETHLTVELFNQAEHGVVLIDLHHHIKVWNRWMEVQTQLPLSEVLAKPVKRVVSVDILPTKILDAITEVFQYEQPISFSTDDVCSYFFEIKPITISGQQYCLLEVFSDNNVSDSENPEPVKTVQDHELAVTAHLLEKISGMNKFAIPGLSVWQQEKSSASFSGDIILSAPRPSGGVNILIGDFVGRGLPAVIGALPVAEVFYGMTEKGFGLSDIIEEINKKLLFILPEGLFCAACLIELEHQGKMLAVWNGGLPDLLVIDQQANIKYRVPSSHIPLGVHGAEKIELETVFIEVNAGDTIFCSTDGAVNAEDAQGNRYGAAQMERALLQGDKISAIQQSLLAHIAGIEQRDDISLVELDIELVQNYEGNSSSNLRESNLAPASWQVDFDFSAQVLRSVDLVPLLVNVLMHIQAPHEHRQRIYTVLAEMCSNALDHGVLGLNSAIKQSAHGFAEYYALRGQRLAELTEGFIKVSLSHKPANDKGILMIRVEDSGKGFDYKQHTKDLAEIKTLCGRGEALLQNLCANYQYSGKGNIIQAEYHWMT